MGNKINNIIGVEKIPSMDTVAGLRSFASGRVLFGGGTRPWAKGGTDQQVRWESKAHPAFYSKE